MKPVDSEMGEIIIQILLDYGIDPDGDSDYAKHIKWEETTDSLWEGLKCWNLDSVASLVAFFFILEEDEKRKYLAPTPQPHQREEEEFAKGPLSILYNAVKNNTAVRCNFHWNNRLGSY